MRLKLISAFLMGLTLGAAGPALTQETDSTDTTLRAAYCFGVLKNSIEHHKTLRPQDPWKCWTGGHGLNTSDPDECVRLLKQIEDVRAYLLDDLKSRRDRYGRYLAMRMLSATAGQASAMRGVEMRGWRDAQEKSDREPLASMITACSKATDLLQCLEQRDQVLANVVRCEQYPDRLPF
jgi:hypothetical protein